MSRWAISPCRWHRTWPYDVADIGPFLRALTEHGSTVVLEVTDRHPWVGLGPLYRQLHGLDRPDGPTADDLIAVVEEVTGATTSVERWRRSGDLWFELGRGHGVLRPPARAPQERWPELTDLLERLIEKDGRLVPTGEGRDLVTIWWATG